MYIIIRYQFSLNFHLSPRKGNEGRSTCPCMEHYNRWPLIIWAPYSKHCLKLFCCFPFFIFINIEESKTTKPWCSFGFWTEINLASHYWLVQHDGFNYPFPHTWTLAYLHTKILAYLCLFAYLHIFLLACLHNYILAYLQTYKHANLHSLIFAYLHTWIQGV